MLWKSPAMQDNALHTSVISSFNHLGGLFLKGNEPEAVKMLIELTECKEVGLGNSGTRVGKKVGEKIANEILNTFKNIPQIKAHGFSHFEEIQLLIDGISKDRISDITSSLIKSFLIDFTIQQSEKFKIPIEKVDIQVYDYKKQKIVSESVYLPVNPENKAPIIFTPKRWLRYVPWINYDDYFDNYYIKDIEKVEANRLTRSKILDYNRQNYGQVLAYTSNKERDISNCKYDPLFTQIPVLSAKRKTSSILNLPTGKKDNADKKYEDLMVQLLASMLYPHLDFAKEQSRTDSGVHIRDLIFYNNKSHEFTTLLYDKYDSRQLVFELKNVEEVETEHINQLSRYLTENFGRFGVIFTRKRPPRKVIKNTIDLWSAHRKCIIIMDDTDLQLMTEVFDSKQRLPIEIVKGKFVEFTRLLPS
ncbi:hypothetical protein A4D02_35425 [Niastella koreensis]|uniref:Restriction endonuclease type IV Mrr domain-containing protein n=1 Tax=Niastella koreensis TaxID=354356 RepID=A0ABX3NS03_9BACT|nr:hypothetical protein A4D02_35425 [Niastella koreensis]